MKRRNDPESEKSALETRVISAALELLEDGGPRSITFRSVAQRAGMPTASVQRRFGTKDRLLYAVYGVFVSRKDPALESIISRTAGRTPPLDAVPSLLTTLLADPARRASQITAIEFLLAVIRNPHFRPLARRWRDARIESWRRLVGAEELAEFLLELELGLALDSIGLPDDPVVALANNEIAAHALLDARTPQRFWFTSLLLPEITRQNEEIDCEVSPELEEFLDAGAKIVLKYGSEAISFRNVADHAQRTFASISSNFRRKDVLVASVCQHMVNTALSAAPPPLAGPRDLRRICEISCDLLTGGSGLRGDYYFLGQVEIRLLAARNNRFSGLARRMRMLNGLYPVSRNDPAYDPVSKEAFVVHSREIWSRGAALLQTAIQEDEALRPALLNRLMQCVERFEIP